jgi:hypothetical protein
VAKKYGRRTGTSRDDVPILLERKKIGFLADLDDLEGAKDVSARTRIRWIVFQGKRIPPTPISVSEADGTSNPRTLGSRQISASTQSVDE